tara:strand:+ start:548 stop:748 length:201 start_codon:yes stop_codon:yes gene_type:complete
MKYAISYDIEWGKSAKKERHTRYYAALNGQTALEMFNETRSHGALRPYSISNITIKPLSLRVDNKA